MSERGELPDDPAPEDAPEGVDAEDHPAPARRSVMRNMASLAGAQVITWTLSTIVLVIVPRRVGPEAIGGYRIAWSLWTVAATFIALGTGTLITLQVARAKRRGVVRLGPAMVARTVAYAISWIPILVFSFAVGYSTEVVVLIAIVGAATLFNSYADVAAAGLTGLERLDVIAAADVFSKLVLAGLTVLVVIVTDDIRIIAAVAIVTALAYSGYLFGSLRRLVRIDYERSLSAAAEAARGGSPYLLIGLTRVVYSQIDIVVISLVVTELEVGWYGTADSVFGTLMFVPTILMTSLFPVFARTHEEDPGAAAGLLQRSFNALLLIAVPVGLGIVVVADQVALLLFGEAFDGTGPVLAVFGVVLIFTFVSTLFGSHAIAIGRQRFWNVVMLIAIPTTVALDLVLIPWTRDAFDNGAIGGALAYVVTESMMVVLGLWKLAPYLASRQTLVRVVKCLTAGGVMVAVCWPLRQVFVGITIAVGAVVFVAVLALLRPLDEDEKQMLRRGLSRFRRAPSGGT
jgi:O-antigen/teichoic acid export membrane protein